MTARLRLIKSVPTLSAKSVLIPLGLSAGIWAADAAIQKKMFGSGRLSDLASRTKALIISNKQMEDIMKIVKPSEKSGLLLKWTSETIKNEVKEQKGVFLSMALWIIAASVLENTLTGKGVVKAGESTIRVAEDF